MAWNTLVLLPLILDDRRQMRFLYLTSSTRLTTITVTLKLVYFKIYSPSPGVVACTCNPAVWRWESLNGLSSGPLAAVCLCRPDVYAKPDVIMVTPKEFKVTRIDNEERTGPGWQHSRQKFSRPAVVGQRLWIGDSCQPVQYSRTRFFIFSYIIFSSVHKIVNLTSAEILAPN